MTKNASTERIALRLVPLCADDPREHRRAEDAGVALEHAEEGEELRRLVLRDHAGEERAAQRLRAALHHADQDREREELRRGPHEVAEHGDHRIDHQADEDRALGADPLGAASRTGTRTARR